MPHPDRKRPLELKALHLRKLLSEPTPAPAWPASVQPAAFDPDRHPAQVHALLQAAYAHGGGAVGPLAQWWPALRDDPEYDPALVLIAVAAGGGIAGVAQCWTSGFVKDLAVAASWRRRGLGEALLLQAFDSFRRRGAAHVDLKVEAGNPSGAERLYRRLGMTPLG